MCAQTQPALIMWVCRCNRIVIQIFFLFLQQCSTQFLDNREGGVGLRLMLNICIMLLLVVYCYYYSGSQSMTM